MLSYCPAFFIFFVTFVSVSLTVVFESWRFKFVFPYPHSNPQVEFTAVVFKTDARGVSPASVTGAKKSTTPFQPVTGSLAPREPVQFPFVIQNCVQGRKGQQCFSICIRDSDMWFGGYTFPKNLLNSCQKIFRPLDVEVG